VLQIKLAVKNHNGGRVREVEMAREKIKVNPVTSRVCEGPQRLAYIRVASFNSQTAPAVASALRELREDSSLR
jgi:C-terminal processing protease CtpA/Prc